MPRIPLITRKDQVAPGHHAIVDGIVASRGGIDGPFVAFLHAPEMAARVAHLGTLVRFEGSLDFRVRVLAAMVVAREYEAMYVWGAQTGNARKRNVPETTIAAIRDKQYDGIPAEDRQVVEFTRDLLQKHRAGKAAFDAMRDRLGMDNLIQLTGTIGYYALLAMTVNACELDPAPGMDVLAV